MFVFFYIEKFNLGFTFGFLDVFVALQVFFNS